MSDEKDPNDLDHLHAMLLAGKNGPSNNIMGASLMGAGMAQMGIPVPVAISEEELQRAISPMCSKCNRLKTDHLFISVDDGPCVYKDAL